jgi:tetratricopeptide (TPR) repeat protein
MIVVLWLLVAQVSSAEPASFERTVRQASAALRANRKDEALRLYRSSLILRPGWPEGWWQVGKLSYDAGRYPESRDALREYVKLDSKPARGWSLLGLSEYRTGEHTVALQHLERALATGEKGPLIVTARCYAGILLTRYEFYEAAQKILSVLAVEGVENPDILEATGLAALRINKLPEETAAEVRKLAAEAGRAVYDARARRTEAARKEFEDLAAHHSGTPNVHYIFGDFLVEDHSDEALAEFRKELAVSPRHVPARLQIALEYLKRGEPALGLPFAEEAAAIAPGYFAAHNALGRILLDLGQTDRSIAELETAVKQAPNSPQSHFALATAYQRAGRKDEAARERAAFLKLNELRGGKDPRPANAPPR